MTKEDLRIVFFGTPEFAVESLAALVDNGYNVCAVVTMPDKIAGRGHKLLSSPVKQYALEHGIKVLQPEKLKNEDFVAELRSLAADLFIVIAFRMLPEVVWTMPPLGTFNLHASLLPRFRGAAPINRAIMAGEAETGVTTFFLKHEIDTGDIIDRVRVDIGPDEDAGSLHDRLMAIGARLTLDTVGHIIAGDLKPIPQDSFSDETPTAAPKIFKDTCRIDWSRPAREIHNHVRGLSPYPAAWTDLVDSDGSQTTAKILKTRVTDTDGNLTPGEIASRNGQMYVGTGSSDIEILRLQPAGKKALDTADFLRGARLDKPKFV